MTPEQMLYFMESLWDLLECVYVGRVIDGKLVKLRDAEFRSAMMFLACALADNGYVNMTHDEGRFVCQTESKDTVRAHLWRLSLVGVMKDKCLNGTTRVKFARFPGRELVTNRDGFDLQEVLTASTEVLTASTEVLTASTEVLTDDPEITAARAVYQQFRAVCQQFRAVRQHPSRNFDGFAQNQSSMLVSQLDQTNPPDQSTNKLTTTAQTTIDPVEEARSVSFLIDAGVWMKTAKQLAKIHHFELLRRAVGFWWANRRSLGGEFDERPGIVISWLTNLEGTTIPETLPSEFMASPLYRRHRTPAEITEEDVVAVTLDESSPGDEIEYAIDDELWQVVEAALQLPDVSRRMWFAGAKLWRSGTRFRLSLDAFQTHQVQNQFRPMLRRTLAQATGLATNGIQLEVCPHDSIER